MKNLLEKLTCFFESNNATEKVYGEDLERNLALERNQPLEIVQNPGESRPLSSPPSSPRRSAALRRGAKSSLVRVSEREREDR